MDECRKQFEGWARSIADNKFPDLSREGDGYWQLRTDTAWKSWQAAWNRRSDATAKAAGMREAAQLVQDMEYSYVAGEILKAAERVEARE